MTGFARSVIVQLSRTAIWELKSVNSRALDLRFRLPQGFDRLEPQLRSIMQSQFKRGTIAVSLSFADVPMNPLPVVNKYALAAMLDLRAELIAQDVALSPSTLEGLLSIKGVMSDEKRDTNDGAEFDEVLLEAFKKVAQELALARSNEGVAIAAVIEDQLQRIETLTHSARADPSLDTEFIAARLRTQLELLMQSDAGLDGQRLHMEAALLATKADIREETDRLTMHVANARQLLKAGDGAGRKLDFLAQEFNREANTLCSKANASTVTAIGLNLKVTIDQFREQIQNLE